MSPEMKVKLGLGVARDYSYLTMVSHLIRQKPRSWELWKRLSAAGSGQVHRLRRPGRPERLLQHPVGHEGVDVHRDGELGDLQAAGRHPAHGQPALRRSGASWTTDVRRAEHEPTVLSCVSSARTFDNLDACVVVRSPDLVTAAALMEVSTKSSTCM